VKATIAALLMALAAPMSLAAATGTANAQASSPLAQRPGALTCPVETSCGAYSVTGLGARKQQVLAAGASVLDLSVAMEETATMQTSAYPYTASVSANSARIRNPYKFSPHGDNKTGDSINFGIFKQNWSMLRTACAQFKGQSAANYNNGAVLNSNLKQDVSCANQAQGHYGTSQWFAGQRAGATGLKNPNTADINTYKSAIYWIQTQLNANPQNLRNDTRFWVYVVSLKSVAASIVGDRAQNGAVVVRAVPTGPLDIKENGDVSEPVTITFSDGTQVPAVAIRPATGGSAYTVGRL
jgi:hypothetical protein